MRHNCCGSYSHRHEAELCAAVSACRRWHKACRRLVLTRASSRFVCRNRRCAAGAAVRAVGAVHHGAGGRGAPEQPAAGDRAGRRRRSVRVPPHRRATRRGRPLHLLHARSAPDRSQAEMHSLLFKSMSCQYGAHLTQVNRRHLRDSVRIRSGNVNRRDRDDITPGVQVASAVPCCTLSGRWEPERSSVRPQWML